MITKPNLEQMSRERLLEYHAFCLAQSINYGSSMTRAGRTGWRRERNRVEDAIIDRDHNPKEQ